MASPVVRAQGGDFNVFNLIRRVCEACTKLFPRDSRSVSLGNFATRIDGIRSDNGACARESLLKNASGDSALSILSTLFLRISSLNAHLYAPRIQFSSDR